MGYSTYFGGYVELDKPVDDETLLLLEQLNDYSASAELFENGTFPPIPNLDGWCDWGFIKPYRKPITEELYREYRTRIYHLGNEKFYDYVEWMVYVVDWLASRGYVCNGTLDWSGEESDDHGWIYVKDNVVTSDEAVLVPQKWYNKVIKKVGDPFETQ